MLLTRYNPEFKNWESKLLKIQKRACNEGHVIYVNEEHNFHISVVPDTGVADAYFKICNSERYGTSTKVIRLSFFDSRYIEYNGDNRELWKLNSNQMKMITDILLSKPYADDSDTVIKTYWQLVCHIWNREWGFAYHPDYNMNLPKGCIEKSVLDKHPQYVALNLQMPDYNEIKFK